MATSRPVRIVFCSSGGLHGSLVLARLLQCPQAQVVGVVHSTRILKPGYGPVRGAWEQLRRSGAAYAFYLWCSTSVAEFVCARAASMSVPRLAAARGIPVLATRNINDAEGMDFVRHRQADILVCAFFNQRLSPALLSIPGIAAVNIHPSLLPEFKGVDPVFYARLRNASRLGVTIHHMAPDLDTGNVLRQATVPVDASSSVFAATAALFDHGAALLTSGLADIAAGERGTAQAGAGDYDSWPAPDQVRALRGAGTALVRIADIAVIAAMARAAAKAAD